jgi:hypothetical protein
MRTPGHARAITPSADGKGSDAPRLMSTRRGSNREMNSTQRKSRRSHLPGDSQLTSTSTPS